MKIKYFLSLLCYITISFGNLLFSQCTSQTGLHFNGYPSSNNNYIETLNPVLPIAANQALTIELWMKLQPYNAGGANLRSGLVAQYECCSNPLRFSILQTAANKINYRNIVTNATFADDSWHHYAVTRSSAGDVNVYVDGLLDASGIDTEAFASFVFRIGQLTANHTFEGVIDELRIWYSERSQAEIQANMLSELTGTETHLELYYNFEDGIADADNSGVSMITDLTGNHSTTLNNFLLSGSESNFTEGICLDCQDQSPPVAMCKDIAITLDNTSSYTLNPLEINNGSSDDCQVISFQLSNYDLDCSDIGTINVDLIVTDNENNSATCSSAITISDTVLTPIEITPIDTICNGDETIVEFIGWDFNTGFTNNAVSNSESGIRHQIAGDLDDDGDTDIIVASFDSDEVVWLRNDGIGNFERHVIISTTDGPEWVEMVDLDIDGDMDLLVASSEDSSVRWLVNDGAENFSEVLISNTMIDTKVVASGDIDGDGDLDIVSSPNGLNLTVWHEMEANAYVTDHSFFNVDVNNLFIEDMDGDGDKDIVTDRNDGSTTQWFKNDGAGNFTGVNLGGNWTRGLAVGDLDNDGDMDIIINQYQIHVVIRRFNDGLGNFISQTVGMNTPRDISIGDFNNDGYPDYAQKGSFYLSIFLNDQNNNFLNSTSFNGSFHGGTSLPVIANVDMDEEVEIINASNSLVHVYDPSNLGHLSVRLDNNPIQNFTAIIHSGLWSYNYSVLSPGVHTIELLAYGYNDDCLVSTSVLEEFTVSDNIEQRWYPDTDGDGFGDAGDNGVLSCLFLGDYSLDNTDCNDNDPDNFPGNTEICDGQDNNCNGIFDEGFITDVISFHDTIALGLGIIANDNFGGQVKAEGNTMAIFSSGNDDEIYFFYRNDCDDLDWQFHKKIVSPGATTFDITEDFLVTGQPFSDSLASNTGAISIFGRNIGGQDNWGKIETILASNWQQNSSTIPGFGAEVCIQNNTIAASGYGRTYMFEKDGSSNNWLEQKQLDGVGSSIDINGDLMVSSARTENDLRGAVYLFERHIGGYNNWGLLKKITAEIGGASQMLFGGEVKLSNELLVVQSEHGAFTGNIHIFERDEGGPKNWGHSQTLIDTEITYNRGRGRLTSIDVKGNLIVCGPGAGNPDGGSGEAIVLKKGQCSADEWGVIRRISTKEFTSNTRNTSTGSSNVILDNQIIVGVPGYDLPGVSGFFHGGVMIMEFDSFEPEAVCKSTVLEMEEDGSVAFDPIGIIDLDACWYSSISADFADIKCEDGTEVLVTLTMTDNNSNVSNCETYINVIDELGSCCPTVLNVSQDPLQNAVYEADSLLYSELTVLPQNNVNFQAFKSIELNSGFEVKEMALFEAYPRGCSYETIMNRSFESTANTDHLNCGTLSQLSGLEEMTIEFWYYASGQAASKGFIEQIESATNQLFVGSGSTGNEDNFVVRIGNSSVAVQDVIVANEWNYWTVSYNGSEANAERIKIYKNGFLQQTQLSGTVPTQIPAVAVDMKMANNMLGDRIDDVGIYNYAKIYYEDEFGNVYYDFTKCSVSCGPNILAFYNMQQDASEGSFLDMSNTNHASIISSDPSANTSTDTPLLRCFQN